MNDQSAARAKPAVIPPIDTILIVDDDETCCFVAKRILQKYGFGQQIITVHNGLEALLKLQTIATKGEKLPELIFLDIKMPIMNGFEFLEEVTQITELNLSQTKIYVCTSSNHSKDKEQASLFPIAGFITKPLTADVLVDILV
ncbi:response regulator [Adhaeribacter aquaticus]|uniref:response regulator n=1 Tax=Adhaeribacter aquaticus TaxID=299567 RepID=UPI00068606A5|nr:response regulator [Adhaeribacter aquaticus]